MSQSKLDDVVSWSLDECNNQFAKTFKALRMKLKEADNLKETAGVLKILCSENFVQSIEHADLQVQLFPDISEKVREHGLSTFAEMKDFVAQGESIERIIEKFEYLKECIHCMKVCIDSINKKESVDIKHIIQIANAVMELLQVSYSHYTESLEIYKDMVRGLKIGSLFNRNLTLQLAFSKLLDKIQIPAEATDDEVQLLTTICNRFCEISMILKRVDGRMAVGPWRIVSRLIERHLEHMKNSLDGDRLVSGLCMCLLTACKRLDRRKDGCSKLTVVDEEKLKMLVEVISVQVEILVTFIRDLTIESSIDLIYEVSVRVNGLHPQSLTPDLPTQYIQLLETHLFGVMDPMLSLLINNTSFCHKVSSVEEIDRSNQFPRCLLLTSIVSLLARASADVVELWMLKVKSNIVKQLFESVKRCHIESCLPVLIPVIACDDESPKRVTLYEHVLDGLSAFVRNLPSNLFPSLEITLLETVVSHDVVSSLMAIDIWCLVSRYGSAELCRDHCLKLSALVKDRNGSHHIGYSCLILLLKRLFQFLSPEHQLVFCDDYPIQDNLELWSILPLSSVSKNVADRNVSALFNVCKTGDLNRRKQLQCLSLMLSLEQTPAVIASTVKRLWSDNASMNDSDFNDLLRLSSRLIVHFDESDLFLMLNSTWKKINTSAVEGALFLSVAEFMANLRKRQFHQQTDQNVRILSLIPMIFLRLLKSKMPLIETRAYEAFTQFAEETSHGNIVPECVQQCDQLQTRVIQFLQKAPHDSSGTFNLLEYLKVQETELDKFYSSSVEPCLKRKRDDNSEIHEVVHEGDSFIDQIDKAVTGLEALTDDHRRPLPDSLLSKLSNIQSRLNQLLNTPTV
ncbi:FIGNL1-interacting regulator of recombination and mitosis-like [Tubulanus polymorphus]|uniref:FIGNL1-interacting regulator of recombination and mitosis-like n=1 Tax=Tubulanus polymorphus TaxID=672921 RepID=UPI003DA4D1CF